MGYSLWDLLAGEDGKLSLSKFQMSLWTTLYFTYSVVYMFKTGLPPELNRGAYFLMGISGATYLGTKTVRAVEKVKLMSLQKQGIAVSKKEKPLSMAKSSLPGRLQLAAPSIKMEKGAVAPRCG